MKTVDFCYGKGYLTGTFEEGRLLGVLESRLHRYIPKGSETELVREAMLHPYGSPRLSEMAKGKKKVTVIASDHTRPVPSRVIMPLMLAEIRAGAPDAEITILIATGCHRGTTREELVSKFGEEIVDNEEIVVHDCDDEENMVSLGRLPDGGELKVNRLAVECDLLCAEGFIEPHFFAGYSGGRKSVLPGIASRSTVLANHCSAFIADAHATTGVIDGNPIHRDMLYAAKRAKLAYIVNVVLGSKKEVLYAVAGDCEEAHRAGVAFLSAYAQVEAVPADIVVSTNGGYPLDQNIYQAVKGMTAANATVKPGGVIIMLAASDDGHGGEMFYRLFREERSDEALIATFLATPAERTVPDQWQAQIFAQILRDHRVIFVSEAPDDMVRDLHMIPAHSLEEAVEKAEKILGCQGTITAIPDGIAVIVKRA